jgi:hypothetical protein
LTQYQPLFATLFEEGTKVGLGDAELPAWVICVELTAMDPVANGPRADIEGLRDLRDGIEERHRRRGVVHGFVPGSGEASVEAR